MNFYNNEEHGPTAKFVEKMLGLPSIQNTTR
jgi:hypothetical protein